VKVNISLCIATLKPKHVESSTNILRKVCLVRFTTSFVLKMIVISYVDGICNLNVSK
jgi:hypothetical protein